MSSSIVAGCGLEEGVCANLLCATFEFSFSFSFLGLACRHVLVGQNLLAALQYMLL